MMYNLTVSEDHTYVVGSGQWVVHNVCADNSLSNQLTQQENQNILSKFNPDDAVFSGVYESELNTYLAMPSGSTAPKDGSSIQTVNPRGGHAEVFRNLRNMEPNASLDNAIGFTLYLQSNDTLGISWRSRSINRRHGSKEAPEEFRSIIENLITTSTGFNLNQVPLTPVPGE